MSISERLQQVFTTTLELPPQADLRHLRQRYDDRWDSLNHMALVVAVEEEFAVQLSPDQVLGMDSFAAAEKILLDLGVAD